MKAFIESQLGYYPLIWIFYNRSAKNKIKVELGSGTKIVENYFHDTGRASIFIRMMIEIRKMEFDLKMFKIFFVKKLFFLARNKRKLCHDKPLA